jgi:tetratricopeptide (TPR) repeat protein
LGRYREAEEKYELALEACKNSECTDHSLAGVYSSLGVSLAKQKKPSRAMFEKSLELAQSAGYIKPIVLNLYWLAVLEFEANNLDRALNFLQQASYKSRGNATPKINADILNLYSLIYAKKNKFEKAFNYQSQSRKLSEDILNGALIWRVASVQTEFQERNNLTKLANQERIMQLQRASIDRQKALNVLTGVVILLAVVSIALLRKHLLEKKRINYLLDQRIRERTSELEANRDQLQHAHDEQVVIISKLSTELNSAVASLRGLTSVAAKDLPDEHAIYFRQAGIVADKLETYANGYSSRSGDDRLP